ncbi:MAG: GNAT family N-acetyltransferase [Acidimicrobiales bacterium]|nr:GNAT family N-acetyltransferase [Acidimicrobiales bacterium]
MSGATLRPAGPDDAEAVSALLAACFPHNPKADPEVLGHQLWSNPWGPPSSWVAEAGGRLVGQYTVFPVPGVVGGRPVLLGKGADAAVAPSHRGQGLFVRLAREAFRGAGRLGLAYTLNHPNESSLRGFVQAGAVPVPGLDVLVRPLDPVWLGARLHLPGRAVAPLVHHWPGARRGPDGAGSGSGSGSGGVAVAETGAVPDGLDALWARVVPSYATGIERAAAWWRWRYVAPTGTGHRLWAARDERGALVGAAATCERAELGGRFVAVLELLAAEAGVGRALLAAVAAGHAGASGLVTVALRGTAPGRLAAAGGLRRLPRRLQHRPVRFCVVDNLHLGRDASGLGWTFCWGDLDHL